MQVGLMVPQGWKGEYDGWRADDAWTRSLELARDAEALGFESLWVFDHFHTVPEPTDELTFESFAAITAIAMVTERVRLGHMVICTGFRNPGLTAKMAGTIDVIAGGRFELGIGAGWKEDEWRAYGYGFPPLSERLAVLADHLEIISRMLEPGRSTWQGEHAWVRGAVNEPRGLQEPRIPIIVGGNGQNVTMRLAARFAEELNLVFLEPDEIAEHMAVARQRCEEIGRDPASLRISIYCRDGDVHEPGPRRVDFIGRLRDLGMDRLVAFPTRYDPTTETQARFAEDCRAAGVVLGPSGIGAVR